MTRIPQKELRNNVGEVLRRAEAGEEFTVTVSGRPVARLSSARPRQWVADADLRAVWETPAPQMSSEELAGLSGELTDPLAR